MVSLRCLACLGILAAVQSTGLVSIGPVSLISPHDGATLITNLVMILIQLPLPGYQLTTNEWVLCVNTNVSGQNVSYCMIDYSGSSVDSTNNTIALFVPASRSGHYIVEASLQPSEHHSLADSRTYTVTSPFYVTLPFSRDEQSSLDQSAALNRIADFTYLSDNSFDMLRMRLREHQPDYLLLLDSNESHSGYHEKAYVIPDSSGVRLPPLTQEAEGTTSKVSPQEFGDLTGTDAWRHDKQQDNAILVHHPPAQGDAVKREPMHRDALALLAKQLELTISDDAKPPDMYVVSDTDEIIHRKAIKALKESQVLKRGDRNKRDTIVFVLLDFHMYNLNWKFPNQQWGLRGQEGAFVIPASLARRLTSGTHSSAGACGTGTHADGDADCGAASTAPITATGIRRLLRPVNRQLLLQLAAEYNIVYWEHAGWHLSQFYTPEQMVRAKMMAFPAPEEDFLTKMWTADNCALAQEFGVPHYMLEGRKQGINYMLQGKNALVYTAVPNPPAVPVQTATYDVSGEPGVENAFDASHSGGAQDEVISVIDAWEAEHGVTLPLAVYEDRALFLRNVHRQYGEPEPDLEARRSAAEHLVDCYAAALPASKTGGQVVYSAPPEAGVYVSFSCYFAGDVNVHTDGDTSSADARTLLQRQEDFYRAEVLEKLFCDDKARCPYVSSDDAIGFSIQWISSRCADSNGASVSIQVLSG